MAALGKPENLLNHRVIEEVFGIRLVAGAAYAYTKLPVKGLSACA
jgi:hypothetical protein